jgi:hypothetical protein
MAIVDLLLIAAVSYVNSFRREYNNSKNAIDTILNELQQCKIIAIGEEHTRVNEQLFLADNIEALYNAGVRYIFAEGGGSDELIENYAFLMFYPWLNSGWRYETLALYDAVKNFNDALPLDDKILIISPEKTSP